MCCPPCPLCSGGASTLFAVVQGADYFDCPMCGLVFKDPEKRPGPAEEIAEYCLHNNDITEPGYRRHLQKLTDPLSKRLPPGAKVLDFGCGPTRTISVLMAESGITAADYDPCFFNSPDALAETYDAITCSEVVEHFYNPLAGFETLKSLIRPGGIIGVMTKQLLPGIDFEIWQYVRHPSHVCFYRPETLKWVADRFAWRLEIEGPDVALFRA